MKHEFDAILIKAEGYPGDAAYVVVPYDVQAAYGTRGMVKVKAYFDGYLYRGSISPMGGNGHCILARQDVRKAIGKQPGDMVHMVVELDTEPRIVDVPEDFAAAMAQVPNLRETFDKMSYSHRKEYVQAILDAKKPETRTKRINQAVEMIKSKILPDAVY